MIDGTAININERLGIRLYLNEQIHIFKGLENDKSRWHIIMARNGASGLTADNRIMDWNNGIIVMPEPMGLDKFICSPDIKGYMLSLPAATAMEMGFSKDMGFYSAAMQNPFARMDEKHVSRMEKYFALIWNVTEIKESPYVDEELRCLCQALLATCRTYFDVRFSDISSSRQDSIANSFIKLVASQCRTERKLNYYAKKLSLSTKYLSCLISSTTGKTASQWIEDHTIMKAKEYLRNPMMTVSSISEKMEFYSASDFSKYFKHATGITPKEYRQHILKVRSIDASL